MKFMQFVMSYSQSFLIWHSECQTNIYYTKLGFFFTLKFVGVQLKAYLI